MIKIIVAIVLLLMIFYILYKSTKRFFGGGNKAKFKIINFPIINKNEQINQLNETNKSISILLKNHNDDGLKYKVINKNNSCEVVVDTNNENNKLNRFNFTINTINNGISDYRNKIALENQNVERQCKNEINEIKKKYKEIQDNNEHLYDDHILELLNVKKQLLQDYKVRFAKPNSNSVITNTSQNVECRGFSGLTLCKETSGLYFVGLDSEGETLIKYKDKPQPHIERGEINTSSLTNWIGYGPDGYFKLLLMQAIYPYKDKIFKIHNSTNWKLFTDKIFFKDEYDVVKDNLNNKEIYDSTMYSYIYNDKSNKIIFEFNENFKSSHFLKTAFNSLNYIFNNTNIEDKYDNVYIRYNMTTKQIIYMCSVREKPIDKDIQKFKLWFLNCFKNAPEEDKKEYIRNLYEEIKIYPKFKPLCECLAKIMTISLKNHITMSKLMENLYKDNERFNNSRKKPSNLEKQVLQIINDFIDAEFDLSRKEIKDFILDYFVDIEEDIETFDFVKDIEMIDLRDLDFTTTFSLVDIDLNSNKKYSLFNEIYKQQIIEQLQYILSTEDNITLNEDWYSITQQTFTPGNFVDHIKSFLSSFCNRCGGQFFDFQPRPSLLYEKDGLVYKTRYYDYVLNDNDQFVEILPDKLSKNVYECYYIKITYNDKILIVSPGENINLNVINSDIPDEKTFLNDFKKMNKDSYSRINKLNKNYERYGLKFEIITNENECDIHFDYWNNNGKMMILKELIQSTPQKKDSIISLFIRIKEKTDNKIVPTVKSPDSVVFL